MNLEQIMKRLDLFPRYLKAKLNYEHHTSIFSDKDYLGFHFMPARQYGVKKMWDIFNKTGSLIYNGKDVDPGHNVNDPGTFDIWLFENQHYDLVDLKQYEKDIKCEGLISWASNYGRQQRVDKWGFPLSPTQDDRVMAFAMSMQAERERMFETVGIPEARVGKPRYSGGIDPYEAGGVLSSFSMFETRGGVTKYLGRSKH